MLFGALGFKKMFANQNNINHLWMSLLGKKSPNLKLQNAHFAMYKLNIPPNYNSP